MQKPSYKVLSDIYDLLVKDYNAKEYKLKYCSLLRNEFIDYFLSEQQLTYEYKFTGNFEGNKMGEGRILFSKHFGFSARYYDNAWAPKYLELCQILSRFNNQWNVVKGLDY